MPLTSDTPDQPADETTSAASVDQPVDQAAESVHTAAIDAGVDPDAEGRLLDLSQQTGVDTGTLRHLSEPHLSSLESLPTRQDVLNRQSDISQWLVDNPIHAAVVGDNVASLENIKQSMPGWLASIPHRDTLGERVSASVDEAANGVTAIAGQTGEMLYGALQGVGDLLHSDTISNYAADKFEVSKNLATYVRAALSNDRYEPAGMAGSYANAEVAGERMRRLNLASLKSIGGPDIALSDAISLVGSMAPTAAVAALGWPVVLAVAAAQTATTNYGELRSRGDSAAKAGTIATAEGLITSALTHFIPGVQQSFQRQLLTSAAKTATARAMFAKGMGAVVAGQLTEQGLNQFVQTFLNDASDTKNPKAWNEVFSNAVHEGIKAGILGGISAGFVGFHEQQHAAQVQEALNFHQENTKLAAAIDESGIPSKTTIQSFMQSKGLRDGTSVHVSADDAHAMLLSVTAADQVHALGDLGITIDSVEQSKTSGGSLEVPAAKLMTADPAIRDRILEVARKTPSSMSSVEATEAKKVMDAQDPNAPEQQQTKANQFAKDFKREQNRIVKQFAAGTGQDEKTIRDQFQPQFERAKVAFLRDPLAAKSPVEALKKIQFNKANMSREEAMQAITDLAGENGKTALSQVSFKDLGQASGRFDVLTGQLEVNDKALPDTIGLAELVQQSKGQKLDLAGKKVDLQDSTGVRHTVDATDAVRTLRERVESARRLAACL